MAKISNTDVMRSEANAKLAQDFIERNKGKTNDELKIIAKNSKMSKSEKRQLLDYLEKNSTRELNKSLSYGDINNSEKLMGAIYDNTPSKQKASRRDVLALSNTKYTNTLLEKILQTQNDTAMSENILKYQQQVVSNLTLIQADLKQLVEYNKPKEVAQTQAERKELEMGVSNLAKSMSNLDIAEFTKTIGTGILKKMDSDGTGELLMSMLGSIKDSIGEGGFSSMIKGMIQDAILDKMPMGNEIKRWREDPVGFSQEIINKLAFSNNSGLRDIFGSHVKGMAPDLTRRVNRIDMAAAATFDNKVHTAITRIIPEQLYRMVALLSGKEIRMFDWESQTYKTISQKNAEDQIARSNQNLTTQIDKTMTALSSGVRSSLSDNPNLKSQISYDINGNMVEDKNSGLLVFKNGTALRKAIKNLITSGCTVKDLADADNLYTLIKVYKLDKDFAPDEKVTCVEAYQYLQAYYRSLSKEDLDSEDQDVKSRKQAIHNRTLSELEIFLDDSEKRTLNSIQNDPNLTAQAMQSIANEVLRSGVKIDGSVGGGSRVPTSQARLNSMTDAEKAAFLDELIRNKSKTLTDEEKDKRIKYLNQLASGTISDKDDDHLSNNASKTVIGSQREEFARVMGYLSKDEIDKIKNNVGIGDDNNRTASWTRIKHDLDTGIELTPEQAKKLKTETLKIYRANEIFQAFDRVGLTANAEAKMFGVSPNSIKNRLRNPTDLYEIINDDGTINKSKLSAFMTKNNVKLDYLTDEYVEDVKTQAASMDKAVINGNIGSSVSKTLSSIFGDPAIANKAGIAVGGAAGLGIAKLLKDQGLITSPKAQYILAAVGGGLMSMERTRKYMQNVFGPDGDIENEYGFTNKQIFFAKAMEKWLPTIGMGGATFKYVRSAMGAFGPVGNVIGLPLAGLASLVVGAAAPSIVRGVQRSLFDRDEDDNSILAKIGRGLKNIPFVQKYFDITGIQDSSQLHIRSLNTIKTQLEAEKAQYTGRDDDEAKIEVEFIDSKIKAIDDAIKDIETNRGNKDLSDEKRDEANNKIVLKLMDKLRVTHEYKDGQMIGSGTTDKYQDLYETNLHEFTRVNDNKKNLKDSGMAVSGMNYSNGLAGDSSALRRSIELSDKEFGRMTEDQISKLTGNQKLRYNFWKRLKDGSINFNEESGEFDLREKLAELFVEMMDEDADAKRIINEIASDEADTFKTIIGDDELYQRFMDLSAVGLSDDEKREEFAKWKVAVGAKEGGTQKLKDIDELVNSGSKRDKLYASARELAQEYVTSINDGRTNKMSKSQLDRQANQLLQSIFTQDMLTRRLKSKIGGKVDQFVIKMKELFDGYGVEKSEIDAHKKAVDLYNELSAGAEVGGRGSKSNTRVKMSELSDKKFKTGEKLSIAGCSVAALNNALYYMGITTIDVDTLINIANSYLTKDGGVSSEFFNAVAEKIGVDVTLYNNRDNTFTPESLLSVKPASDRGLIILLKNKDGNGYHYVTGRKIDSKNTTVDDPELNNSSTRMSTGDICVRAQELIVLKKVSETKALKESPISDKLNDIKSVINTGRDLISKVQKDGFINTVKSAGMNLINNKVINPLLNSTIPMTGMSVRDVVSGSGDLVRGILDGLKDMVLNIRMVDDLTLPLKMGDPEAARAVANIQGMSATDRASKTANQNAKKLISNKDVSNALNEEDDMQDAVMTLASLQGGGMIAGRSTGAGGRGTSAGATNGDETVDPNAPHQTGPLAGVLGAIGGLFGTKGMKFLPSIAKIAGLAGLGGLMYTGAKKIGIPAWKIAKDQFRKGLSNLPIIGNREEIEYQYDENGNVIEGQHKDATGAFRNIRDAANMTKVALGSVGAGVKGLEKVAKLSNSSSKVLSTIGKYSDDLLNNSGTVGKILTGFGKLANAAIGAMNKFGLGKIGFMGDGAKALLGTAKDKIGKWIGKMLPKLAAAGSKKGAQTFLKKIPLLGSAISLGQFTWALIDGYRHSEAYTGVDPDRLDWKQKLLVGLAKGIYDAGFEFMLSLANFVPGLGTALQIGWSVLRATGVVRLDDFLKLFNVSKEDLLDEAKKEENKEKAATNKINNDIDEDTKEINKEAKQTNPDVKKMQEEYNRNVMMLGKSTADKIAEGKYGSDWQNVVYPSSKMNDNAVASTKDAKSILTEEFTAQSEGFRSKWYYDSEGKRTIGYGFNLDDGPFTKEQKERWLRDGITEEEARQVLKEQMTRTRKQLEKREWFNKLDPVRQGAIVDMAYNMGTGGVDEFEKMIAAIEKGDYDTAAKEVLNSKYARQTGQRAIKVSNLMRFGGEEMTSAPDMSNSQSLEAMKVYNDFKDKQMKDLTPEERQELEKKMSKNPNYKIWKEHGKDFVHPLKNRNAVVTSAYGPRNVTGGSNPHKGIDLRGDSTTPVYATKDGKVIASEQAFGQIKIRHDDSTVSNYLHLSKRFPKAGDTVKAGEQIGVVGGIGGSGAKEYNEHLHFGLYNKRGNPLDPFIQLGLDPSVFKMSEPENQGYLQRNEWLLAQSQQEADKLVKAEEAAKSKDASKPEKLGLNTEKGGTASAEKVTAADLNSKYTSGNYSKRELQNEIDRSTMINIVSENSRSIEMLSVKFDQMIQLLSQIANATGQISNNSMSDFNAPSVIR